MRLLALTSAIFLLLYTISAIPTASAACSYWPTPDEAIQRPLEAIPAFVEGCQGTCSVSKLISGDEDPVTWAINCLPG